LYVRPSAANGGQNSAGIEVFHPYGTRKEEFIRRKKATGCTIQRDPNGNLAGESQSKKLKELS
jgi:hypothetical protein